VDGVQPGWTESTENDRGRRPKSTCDLWFGKPLLYPRVYFALAGAVSSPPLRSVMMGRPSPRWHTPRFVVFLREVFQILLPS
jgi:hypothetical protein